MPPRQTGRTGLPRDRISGTPRSKVPGRAVRPNVIQHGPCRFAQVVAHPSVVRQYVDRVLAETRVGSVRFAPEPVAGPPVHRRGHAGGGVTGVRPRAHVCDATRHRPGAPGSEKAESGHLAVRQRAQAAGITPDRARRSESGRHKEFVEIARSGPATFAEPCDKRRVSGTSYTLSVTRNPVKALMARITAIPGLQLRHAAAVDVDRLPCDVPRPI